MNRALATALLLRFLAAPVSAAGAGTSTADFLNIGVGARQAAMGEAAAGLADDVTALYWNPAGLGGLRQKEAGFQHDQWFGGTTYDYGAYAQPTRSAGTFAAHYAFLNFGSIPASNEFGAPLGNTTARDSQMELGWGSPLISDRFHLGVGVKWIQEKLDAYSANGYAADLGGLARLYENPDWSLQAGAGARNLGQGLKFISASQPLPAAGYAGFGLKALQETLAADLDIVAPRDGGPSAGLGLEYWIHPLVAFRAGYRSDRSAGTGLNAGIGLKFGKWSLDYGFSDFGELGYAHRAGLSFRFGSAQEELYSEGVTLIREGRYAEAILKLNAVLQANPRHRRAMLRMKEAKEQLSREQESLHQP